MEFHVIEKEIKHAEEQREWFGYSGVIVAILHVVVREGLKRRWYLSRNLKQVRVAGAE